MLTIALIDPQIPPNTGTIARLCGATNTKLDLVGSLGFSLDDKKMKRAGLDYWEHINWQYHPDKAAYLKALNLDTCHFFSAKVSTLYTAHAYADGDTLIFGSETKGLGPDLLDNVAHRACTIPMENPNIRSMNLAVSVGIGLYEAIRQINKK